MKRSAIFFIVLLGLTMSGCLVTSLHPFFKTKDIIYDESLLGTWMDSDSSLWVIEKGSHSEGFMKPDVFDSTYYITYYEKKDQPSYLKATFFELDGAKYVDFYPNPDKNHFSADMTQFHHVPVHTLARVITNADSLMFFWFGQEWLDKLFQENRIRIAHEEISSDQTGQMYVLTAKTDELQKFIKKYMNDKFTSYEISKAFDENEEIDDHVFLKLFPHNTGKSDEDKK